MFAPERLEEFEVFYTGDKKAKSLDHLTAGATHYLLDIQTTYGLEKRDYYSKFVSAVQSQIYILQSVFDNLDDVLFNLESEIHYGIFKTEIEVSKELLKHKQFRAAGAVAGVVIEEHLKLTCSNKGIKFRKKNPSMSDYNEALKKDGHLDTVTWRLVSRCADIRNYCVHSKEREPTEDEIQDIIRGAEKVIAEVS